MVDIGNILKEMLQLHPEFSLKIGQKGGTLVVEIKIAGYKPGAAMGDNLVVVLNQAHGDAMRKIADRLLAESRLSDAVFDNAIAETEEDGDQHHDCCGCCGHNSNNNDDEEYCCDNDLMDYEY
jgi:hypothetical protein